MLNVLVPQPETREGRPSSSGAPVTARSQPIVIAHRTPMTSTLLISRPHHLKALTGILTSSSLAGGHAVREN
jgi:hypothetical protein